MLATIPLAEDVPGARRLFDIVFVMVVIYTLVSGPTLPAVARRLRVARRSEPRELDVEAAPLERISADLLQVRISPKSRMHGVEVGELRLPRGASVALIVRDGVTKVPEWRTVLRRGDDVTILKTEAAQASYAPEKLSMEKTVGAFSPEDRIGALELQNLNVSDNRALLLHYAQALSLPQGSNALKGLLEE